MNPRSIRVAVIGFPNVGKSALINRLMGKRVAKSMNIPGVTKKMNWVRLGGKDTKVYKKFRDISARRFHRKSHRHWTT